MMKPPKNEQIVPSDRSRSVSPLVVTGCWWTALFLVLAALTIESLSSSPARLRLLVVVLAGGLVLAGFFFIFAKKPASGTYVGLRRFNAVMIWVVAAGVAGFALAPREDPSRRAVSEKAVSSVAPGVDEARLARANKKTFLVEGMVCQSCVETVTEALLGVPGVLSAVVQLEGGRAVVSSDPDAAPPDTALVTAVVKAGYKLWPASGGDSGENEQVEETDD